MDWRHTIIRNASLYDETGDARSLCPKSIAIGDADAFLGTEGAVVKSFIVTTHRVCSDGREFERLVEVTVPAAGQQVRTVHGQNLAVTEARAETNGVPYVIADGLTLALYQIVGIAKRIDLVRPSTNRQSQEW
jgi:hypothetical protein